MTASEKNKLKIFVALVVIAGAVWFLVYGRSNASARDQAGSKPAGTAKELKATQDARIRLDQLNIPAAGDAGRKNLFQYRQKPAPPPPVTQQTISSAPPPPQVYTPPPPTTPLPPPFKAFRYEGFSGNPTTGKILASLSESGTTYYVREGECLMGQYCVRRLTEKLVEVEDIIQNRRQTFTITQ
jgi:hypothetical protein